MPGHCHDLHCDQSGKHLDELLHFGGFPEPLLEGSERTLLRWQNERFERVFREDIRETEKVHSLSQVELLGALLPQRVASPLSLSSMSEDVQARPKSIISWMDLLCRNYYCFRIMPYHHRLERALKKGNYSGGCWKFAQPPTVTDQMCSRFVHLEIRSVLVLLEKL